MKELGLPHTSAKSGLVKVCLADFKYFATDPRHGPSGDAPADNQDASGGGSPSVLLEQSLH